MSEVIKLPIVKSTSYISQVSTVVAINGPSGDGLVHLHFYRDVIYPAPPTFEKRPVVDAAGANMFELVPVLDTSTETVERQAIATISLSPDVLAQLPQLISQHLAKIGASKA